MVIKYAVGNNNQDFVWKFCVVQHIVQCPGGGGGLLIKEEN